MSLYEKLKNNTLETAIKTEESDLQFLSLKKLYENIENKKDYLKLIVGNSIICYQLSSSGEKYWEEFNKYFSEKEVKNNEIVNNLANFIRNSKGNKRFVEIKVKRLNKIKDFLENDIESKYEVYYENMTKLRDDLASILKQKKDAKTIVFAVKMFSYGARNYFDKFIEFPKEIEIPIDSRLTNIYDIYSDKNSDIKTFYNDLSKNLAIAPLHLDAIIWCNYEKLIK